MRLPSSKALDGAIAVGNAKRSSAAGWREDAAGERGVLRKYWVCFPDVFVETQGRLA